MAEDDQEHFLQNKEENKWERRDVGKCKCYLLAPCLSITNTSKLLKNYQDNRTLVLVLKNEKSKRVKHKTSN